MRKSTQSIALVLVAAAGAWFAGCNSAIDDADGPNVVLEVENITIPPVSASVDSNGSCTFTITPATGSFKNKPKNLGAEAEPFNDIILKTLDVSYLWDDGVVTAGTTTGLGGAVPANGTSTASFYVVDSVTIDAGGNSRAGHTAALMLTFNGVTVSGDPVSVTTGGSLLINSCVQPNVGACCQGASCSQQTLQDCANSGGTYQGDFSTCVTTVCQ
jgi:hypothetical protein